jgi:hypothetical protein
MDEHINNGWCVSRQNLHQIRKLGYDVPSHYGSSIRTVQMLARYAGIKLEREPVDALDYGRNFTAWAKRKTEQGRPIDQRYVVKDLYVAPTWLIKLAAAWRHRRARALNGKPAPFPKKVLVKLPEAVDNERLQQALITSLTLRSRK